ESTTQLKSRFRLVDLKEMAKAKLSIVAAACMALFLSACSRPQSLIVGKWEAASAKVGGTDNGFSEVASAIKMTAEFRPDGTATITMFGQTLQGTYKLNAEKRIGVDTQRPNNQE